MGNIRQMGAAALLVLALSACTGGTPDPAPPPPEPTASAAAVSLETGTDVGNGRPAVSHDGLMVRRRAVIAVHPTPEADLGSVRARLDQTAAGTGMVLSEISPDVLDPAILEHLVPELIVALPPERTSDDAAHLAELAFGPEGSYAGVEHVHVASVLVHDLQFTVASTDPAALAEAIATEGILSDALGSYTTSPDAGALAVSYTGPLLSDALVDSVRDGMARSAGVDPGSVSLTPRSATGEGVDLSKEPEPAPEPSHDASSHDAGHDASGQSAGQDGSGH